MHEWSVQRSVNGFTGLWTRSSVKHFTKFTKGELNDSNFTTSMLNWIVLFDVSRPLHMWRLRVLISAPSGEPLDHVSNFATWILKCRPVFCLFSLGIKPSFFLFQRKKGFHGGLNPHHETCRTWKCTVFQNGGRLTSAFPEKCYVHM